jgi:hypothetical protein
MARSEKLQERDRLVAASLYAGDPPKVACERAGYSKNTIHAKAGEICRREAVQSRLREIARNIGANELTSLGKARIKEKLTSGQKNDRDMLSYIRTGCELEGALGNHVELGLHLHEHEVLGPEQHAMIAEAVRKAFEKSPITVLPEGGVYAPKRG